MSDKAVGKKYTPAHRSKPERQTSYLSSSVFVFYRWLLHDLGYDVAGSDIEKYTFTQVPLEN
ncbi:hypothetical protein, partial [Segatella oris]|uniref:hypothetical protein n=1 Tax=Segatella oris TaxID=28135 RepID=UPI00360A562B